MHMVPLLFFPQSCFHSYSVHSSVSSPDRPLPSVVHRTTLQSITITSKMENIKEEQRNRPEPLPSTTFDSPTAQPSSLPVSSPLSPPAQPSLLASLLARKRSIVTVPATKEVSPPLRGSSRPSPDHLPYLPHSPFHLFSYDLDEEPSPPAPAKPSEEAQKMTSPRSEGRPKLSHEALAAFLASLRCRTFLLSPPTSVSAVSAPAWISLHHFSYFITSHFLQFFSAV